MLVTKRGIKGYQAQERLTNPPKTYTKKHIDYLCETAKDCIGHNVYDVMFEEIERQPSIECAESRTISVPLW